MLAGHGCSSRSDCRGTASDEVCACHDLVNEDSLERKFTVFYLCGTLSRFFVHRSLYTSS